MFMIRHDSLPAAPPALSHGCLPVIAVSPPHQVLAARPGVVVALCSHFGEGGMKRSLRPRANFVALRHGDGTYTRYVHLLRDGVLVRLGQVNN